MLNKIDIIQMSKHVLRRNSGLADRRLMHPGRDWLLGLLLAALVFVSGGAWTGYQYVYVSTLEPEIKQPLPIAKVNRAELQKAIDFYAERRSVYEAVLSAPTTPATSPDSVEGGVVGTTTAAALDVDAAEVVSTTSATTSVQ